MKSQVHCSCGFDVDHPMVVPELHYSPPKWVFLILGATPFPSRVDYECTRCHSVLDTTKDPEVLRTF